MDWWIWILTGLLVAGILVLGFSAKAEDEVPGYYHPDPSARIQQYRESKRQSSTYAEMDEWNDAIDEARTETGERR